MPLVIVESPTKARKLSSYLGSDFKVKASIGHVRDLPKSKLGIDLDNELALTYEVDEDKQDVVKELKKLAKKNQQIYLAMDPDREGEAIAWHIKYLLGEDQKKKPKFLRATFHEITKSAVLAAMDKPGKINMHLVDAQQARRVVDRLVGYKISPVLWRKVRRGLSAGRVQSVALRLIVEREREIKAFKPDEYWEIEVGLAKQGVKTQQLFKDHKAVDPLPAQTLVADLYKVKGKKPKIDQESKAKPIIKDLTKASYQVQEVKHKQRRRHSYPPFTTSTLQQTAAHRLGFSAKRTMRVAQQLYEEGLITYHRTDSVNLSQAALKMAREFVKAQYGTDHLTAKPRVFKGKSKNAQEAHEAIRVTKVKLQADQLLAKSKKFKRAHQRLYDLIWRRFVATQMKPAVYDQTTVLIAANTSKKAAKPNYLLKTVGSVLKFAGWTKLFKNTQDKILPELKEAEDLQYLDINPQQKFTQPPPRFNDASLVKELEKRGIGRPSTYASIISVILDRGYVERVEKRFQPTAIGTTVNDFLMKHFDEIMDYDFTAEMEEDLDRISRGEKAWKKVVKVFWEPLAKKIKKVIDKAKRMKVPVEKTGEPCPKCGKEEKGELVIRTGRYGKFKSCSRFPDCKYTENLVEKVEGVRCPLCHKGKVVIKKTRWGKSFYGCGRYPDCDWASWKKPKRGDKISAKKWAEIKKKRAARKAKYKKKKRKKK
ncbi:MAG: type I DNA topoisomerase [Candidatus Pacebacteria bacterium]|nr:type I DNA topoisomerase [Candidatus Paceibacterota bacterium]